MRIASFFLKPTQPEEPQDPTNPPLPSTSPSGLTSGILVNAGSSSSQAPQVVTSSGIWNDHEPASSDEEPSPAFANYYKSDDFVYHRLAGKWKRTALKTFQQNP
ncbi:MAG: hypothetical protein RBR84_12570 [Bacteroidales bacterium]|jgi:hypothetical protein|nr:hypothetical protein [Bacteroidales bacterium]